MSPHVNMQKIRYFRRDGRFFAGRLAFEENGYSILSHRAAHHTLLPRITHIGIKRYINQKRRFLVCLCTELWLWLTHPVQYSICTVLWTILTWQWGRSRGCPPLRVFGRGCRPEPMRPSADRNCSPKWRQSRSGWWQARPPLHLANRHINRAGNLNFGWKIVLKIS